MSQDELGESDDQDDKEGQDGYDDQDDRVVSRIGQDDQNHNQQCDVYQSTVELVGNGSVSLNAVESF